MPLGDKLEQRAYMALVDALAQEAFEAAHRMSNYDPKSREFWKALDDLIKIREDLNIVRERVSLSPL